MNRTARFALAAVAGLAGATAPSLAQAPADERASYSYVRTIDGRATLASSLRAPGEEVGLHEPLQLGDQVQVETGARLEIVLADRNLLRVGGGSSLRLTQVAFSADGDDRTTRLALDRGEIVLDVTDEALGDELPEIRTPAGTVYVHQPGRYRLLLSATGDLQLAVREGYAELLTESGSTVVRGGEEAWTAGDRWGRVEVGAAGPRGTLERWGEELEQSARRASYRELRVEPHLAYSAAALDDYGSWVYVDADWYWRPRVAVGWRPYWDGRWAWTPSGLTWVSNEPWGWVPYHYGSWRLAPGYGWVWQPGRAYAPAWVYWHVGTSWTGWCPIGYYTHHYRNYWDYGFRFGVYGWAGGHWGFYADWSFLPTGRLFHRDGHAWRRTGGHLGRTERHDVPRGVLTTDTAGLPRERWQRPDELLRDFDRRAGRRGGPGEGLVEVTDFVARRPNLPPTVENAVRRDPGERGAERRGTPLDPGGPAVVARRGQPDDTGWRARESDGRRGGVDLPSAGRTGAPAATPRLGGGFGRERAAEAPGATRSDTGSRATSPNGWSDRGRPESSGDSGRPTFDRRPATPAAGDDRQGWRRVSGSAPRPTDDRPGAGATAPGVTRRPVDTGDSGRDARSGGWSASPSTPRPAGEPVSRVIGGVRRSTPSGERGFDGPPGAGAPPRSSPQGAPRAAAPQPRSPVATTPPVGWRGSPNGAATPSAPPTARSAPAPRGAATPPPAARSTPPPRGGSAVSSGSASGGRSQPSANASRGQGSRSSSSSSQSSSPPPRRGKPPGGG
jgi:hypothetical protein